MTKSVCILGQQEADGGLQRTEDQLLPRVEKQSDDKGTLWSFKPLEALRSNTLMSGSLYCLHLVHNVIQIPAA